MRAAGLHLAAHTWISYAIWEPPPAARPEFHPAASHAVGSVPLGSCNRGLDHGREDRRQHQTRPADDRQSELFVPDLRGNDRPVGRRHLQALRPGRHLHLRSGLHLDRQLRVQDHLYRRRRRHPALSRLSDRADRRARRLPRDLLPPALRRAADPRPEVGLRQSRDQSHDGPRADEPVLPGLPPRRASDGDHDRLRRRAVGVLSRLHRHLRSASAHGRVDPHDREDADDRGDGLQVFDRPAVHLSEERARLRDQLPAHVLRGAVRGVQGQRGAGARHGPHLHPARRPRAERVDLDGAARRLVRRQSVRLHRGRLRLAVGARAWRRQRGRAQDAGRDRPRRAHPRIHQARQGQERLRSA